MQTTFMQLLPQFVLHFFLSEENTIKFTYSVLNSGVYYVNNIRDLTNINAMHFYSDILLKRKMSLVCGISQIFCPYDGTVTSNSVL